MCTETVMPYPRRIVLRLATERPDSTETEGGPSEDQDRALPAHETAVVDEGEREAEAAHRENADEADLKPTDRDEWRDKREQSEHERVLRQRRADRVADVDVPLSLDVSRDRVGDLGQVRPDRDENEPDDERGRPESRRESPGVGNREIAREQRDDEPADQEEDVERDLHRCLAPRALAAALRELSRVPSRVPRTLR